MPAQGFTQVFIASIEKIDTEPTQNKVAVKQLSVPASGKGSLLNEINTNFKYTYTVSFSQKKTSEFVTSNNVSDITNSENRNTQ